MAYRQRCKSGCDYNRPSVWLALGTTACKWDNIIPLNEYANINGKSYQNKEEFILDCYKRKMNPNEIEVIWNMNKKDGMWQKLNKLIKPNGAIVLFGSEPFSSLLRVSNLNNFKYDWIWEKQKASNFMGAKYGPLKYHEVISVFSDNTHFYSPQKYKVLEIEEILKLDKKRLNELFISRDYDRFGKVDRRKTINNPTTNKEHIGNPITRTRNADDGYRNPKSIIKINKEINTNIHPTQKPVALMEYLIKTYTNEGDTVLDFTMGSFTTAIACLNTKRNFIGIELDKNYFKIGSERIHKVLSEKEKR